MIRPKSITTQLKSRYHSSSPELLKHSLRDLLREAAQPVAVVTTVVPQLQPPAFHGTTLSSFTSIALDPLPLVAFSLRLPSRLALALTAHAAAKPHTHTHMVVNILSAAQPHIARLFSRPDLHPFPFAVPELRWELSPDGFPVIKGALGALSCTVVGQSMPLSDSPWLHPNREVSDAEAEAVHQKERGSGSASELFIARVVRVEDVHDAESKDHLPDDELRTLPLIYHQRNYTTVRKTYGVQCRTNP